jgi:hypothetical protein
MTIILEQHAIPETGTFEIRQTVNISVSAEQARRQVDSWLLNEVSYMIGAEAPTLVVGERAVWRVPTYFSAPGAGRVGAAGTVDVDTQTGEFYKPSEAKRNILRNVKALAKKLPLGQLNEPSSAYVAENTPRIPILQVREDGELVEVSSTNVQ